MLIELRLKPPTFMWFLPSGLAHLSDENPGPITIDFAALTDENKVFVVKGIQANQILSSTDIEELKKFTIGSTRKIGSINADEEHPLVLSEEDLKRMASNILNKVPATIKSNINDSSNIRLLRIMLELEKDTRDREHIYKCLESRLDQLTKAVQLDIEKKTSSVSNYSNLDPLSDKMQIVESEEKEITIDV